MGATVRGQTTLFCIKRVRWMRLFVRCVRLWFFLKPPSHEVFRRRISGHITGEFGKSPFGSQPILHAECASFGLNDKPFLLKPIKRSGRRVAAHVDFVTKLPASKTNPAIVGSVIAPLDLDVGISLDGG